MTPWVVAILVAGAAVWGAVTLAAYWGQPPTHREILPASVIVAAMGFAVWRGVRRHP